MRFRAASAGGAAACKQEHHRQDLLHRPAPLPLPAGANYEIHAAGRYTLRDGVVRPVAAAPVLLVSDLDDTLVGDDAGTAAFAAWWRAHQAPAGGRLVYNTGRALDLFLALLAEKGGALPEPDLLISSLGTKVRRCRRGGG